jgi:hypothetical protein
MAIVNRRNAVIGWTVWQVGKRVARKKAKSAAPTVDTETKRPNKTAIAAGLAAVAGLLLFWRKKAGRGEQPPWASAEQPPPASPEQPPPSADQQPPASAEQSTAASPEQPPPATAE